jgi:hypothetical protein
MNSTKRVRSVWKFSRQLFAVLVLVTAVAFLGVALEHSRLSNVVAPHVSVVVRPVRPVGHHVGVGPPPDLTAWPPVIQLLLLMAAITLVVVTADTVRRASRRR